MLFQLMLVALALAWSAILFGIWLGWQLLRQNGRLLLRLEELEKRLNELEFGEDEQPRGLPVGGEAPDFALPDLGGEIWKLAQYQGQPLLLIFFNPACGFCRELVPKLAALICPSDTLSHPEGEGMGESRPVPVILSTGGAEANRSLFAAHKLACPVLLQKDSEVATAYQANGTPSGYLISREGKIASELAKGAEALLSLTTRKSQARGPGPEGDQNPEAPASGNGDGRAERFRRLSLTRSRIKRDGLKAGTPAPDFRLPRLNGEGELALSDLRGRQILLIFSSPSCGPCLELAPQLEKFHRAHPELELLMISKGEPKENRAKVKEHGLTFPIVLQQQWEISRLYAMFATPIAYLIDEQGIIVQDVAVGGQPILALLQKLLIPFQELTSRAV